VITPPSICRLPTRTQCPSDLCFCSPAHRAPQPGIFPGRAVTAHAASRARGGAAERIFDRRSPHARSVALSKTRTLASESNAGCGERCRRSQVRFARESMVIRACGDSRDVRGRLIEALREFAKLRVGRGRRQMHTVGSTLNPPIAPHVARSRTRPFQCINSHGDVVIRGLHSR